MDRITTKVRFLPIFAKTVAAYISWLFLLDLWRHRAARPVLVYAFSIHIMGMILFNWLEGWGHLNALYFTFTTLATIGYGDFVPTSAISKILTIFFSINGIVLLLMLYDLMRHIRTSELRKNSEKLERESSEVSLLRDARGVTLAVDEVYSGDASSGKAAYASGEEQTSQSANTLSQIKYWLVPVDLWRDRESRHVLIYAAFIIAVGAFLFHRIEGWAWLNSTYFVVISLATIGFGDFVPMTSLGKIITIFYGLNGIVIFLGVFDSIRRARNRELRKTGVVQNDG